MTEHLVAAAFGDRPGVNITAVPADPRARWLAAVALGGQGRYAAAATVLSELCANPDPTVASLAGSTLASHRRQLGGHAAARVLDAAALRRLALPLPDPEAQTDALLGLAADAIGMGRIPEARRLVAAAHRIDAPGWRGGIRREWVCAEIELGAGHAAGAVPHAEAAAERAAGAGSTRHRIKSALVLGAALAARGRGGDRDRAHRMLDAARLEAAELDLLPLVWPCSVLLGDLDPASGLAHRRRAGDALLKVLRRTDPVGRRLAAGSPWMPDPGRLTG